MTHEQIIHQALSSPDLIAEISAISNVGGVTIYESYSGGISAKRTPSANNDWKSKPEINVPSAPDSGGLKLTTVEVVNFLNEEIDVLKGYSYSRQMALRLGLDE